MNWFQIIWTDEVIEHIAEHGLTPGDVDPVLYLPEDIDKSDSTGLPAYFGRTPDGRYIVVVFFDLGDGICEPVTAYPVPEPRQ